MKYHVTRSYHNPNRGTYTEPVEAFGFDVKHGVLVFVNRYGTPIAAYTDWEKVVTLG